MTIRTALTDRNLTGENRRDAIIAAYCDEIEAEYIERDEDAAQQPVYDAASHQRTIEARYADAANPDPQYVSLPQLMSAATVYNDWETFTRAVDDTDCTGQWDDRGQDH